MLILIFGEIVDTFNDETIDIFEADNIKEARALL